MSTPRAPAWTAVLPVKAWIRAKTRLEAPERARAEFARAVALDTLDTVAASVLIGRIVIVTSEPEFSWLAADVPSAVVLDEPPGEPTDRLNSAVRLAQDWAARRAPTSPIVVVPADLAALTTATLDEALQRLARFDRAHVPDHRGTGTTLSAAARPDLLTPRYGPASGRAHAAAGSTPILDVDRGVRLDVDDLGDLTSATSLGLGRRARAIRLADRLADPTRTRRRTSAAIRRRP